jgi:glutamyl-Q tRNA(Asp) synthetase
MAYSTVSPAGSITMYVGRFAPSPTGPLHFGSLIAAVASYLEARTHDGLWLLRIEDIDQPRVMPGAVSLILESLERFGFTWDGEVLYQSQRISFYQAAFENLLRQDLVYPCGCSRKEIADSASHGIDGLVYPGTCRQHAPKVGHPTAWRVKVDDIAVHFNDAIQGPQQQYLSRDIGDFVLKRADGLFAYQLAVVVDDAWQNVTHVVRGADLLNSTSRQIYLQSLLAYQVPAYAHLPLAVNAQGEKLSKQTLAAPLDLKNANSALWQALTFLGQPIPQGLAKGPVADIWAWALQNWQLRKVRPHNQIITT